MDATAATLRPHKHASSFEGSLANVCWWGVYPNPNKQANVDTTQKKNAQQCKQSPKKDAFKHALRGLSLWT